MRIKLASIASLWGVLPRDVKVCLRKQSEEMCHQAGDEQFPHEPPSMTVRCLLTDCVQELIYREEQGRDGNWEEFAGNWLTDDAADEILHFMKHYLGWTPGQETF